MKIKLLELKQIIREAMLQENHPTPDSMLIFAQDILGYAYDGEGVEDINYFAQDDHEIETAAEAGGHMDSGELEYFLMMGHDDRAELLKSAS